MTHPIRYLATAIALIAGLACASSALADSARKVEHVIIIGVDGLSPDGVMKAQTPILQDMMKHGSWSLHARGVLPTTSGANWASILNGVGPEQHGVTSNDWKVGEFNFPSSVTGSGGFFPSIFQVLFDQQPQLEVGSIYQWDGFGNLYDHRFVDYDVNSKDEADTAALAIAYIKARKPGLLFVHFDDVDHAGHEFGHGTARYYDAVARVDTLIGQIRQATEVAGIADRTVILVTSDHGGVGKGHGGESLAELEIPWIAYGQAIKPGVQLDLPINTFDTAATTAWLLGAKIPYAWLGRPVTPILKGEAAPEQAYRSSSFYASPVIAPARDGTATAGGLFVAETVQMTLSNPNPVGEIRYTLDSSFPTPASPLYAGPVTIRRNTIVRATLFVDSQAASVPATGFFRMLDPKTAVASGVTWKAYLLPEGPVRLPDFTRLQPAASGTAHEISLTGLKLPREDSVAVVFEGDLQIAAAGTYGFSLASDDGSKLYIDGKPVVDNDGDHGVLTAGGSIDLTPGKHAIRVEWFNGGGGAWLGAYVQGPGLPRQFIDPNGLTPR
ncbi:MULTISPECIES: alkaline phosphatase family protein [unclassified Caulobacter]|uniref:alkaline phosphatase family protein n=1 Tax=unclassified Caulobacter TaxID=2648921 RepID=UPI000D3754DD|nr:MULTISPECIES: alkaline phosphatase family protein [unclassified Caulobacter]PTS90632.1 phosphodiesterase [Caulobacter sp. HMWF009]PTT05007.1 phosphodiesterase [Caulobacter sp. HMWF025]